MKKYHIADVLTALRGGCALGLLVLVFVGIFWGWPDFTPVLAFGLFVFGELTDAFDGEAARKWRYPKDGKDKYRWWRDRHVAGDKQMAVLLDQVADILLGATTLVYVMAYCSLVLGLVILVSALVIGAPVQLWRAHRIKRFGPDEKKDPLRVRVVLARRYLYVLALIVVGFSIYWQLPLVTLGKGVILALLAILGAGLVFLKRKRLMEDKTK